MDFQQLNVRCPFCSEVYKLDKSLEGRVVACHRCRKTFRIEKNASERLETPSTSSPAFSQNASSPSNSKKDDFDSVSPEIIQEFTARYPSLPPGVWQVGETLLDGVCQVLPLSSEKLFAEGGVGIVQRVRRRDWNVDLIVKSPKPKIVQTEFGKESFERECQTWIELGLHANIVSCYFVRRIDGIPRLFAELAPDGTLNDWIADGRLYAGTKRDSLLRIIDASIQFAWGLEHAHQQGLLHLDVKPSNVMTSGSTIKVTDFGLSKFVSNNSENGPSESSHCDGLTPSYCSPEQYEAFRLYRKSKAEGNDSVIASTVPMTKQSDIWSWAISVLSMFHGRSPCKKGGQTAAKVFDYFIAQAPSDTRPTMPPGMIDLLKWCFQENPSNRPGSMQVVADQLVQIYRDCSGNSYPRRQPKNAALTAESFSNHALSLLDLGKTPEALSLLRQAVGAAPNNPQIKFNYMLALWRMGQIRDEQALESIDELTRNNSTDPSSFYVFGLIHQERGKLQASVTAFNRALELEPTRKDVKRSLEEAEKLLPYDSLCANQHVLSRRDESKIPALFIDETGEFFLVELSDETIAILKIQTGQILSVFCRKKSIDSDQTPRGLSAVSEDYQWNMRSEGANEIVVSTVAQTRDSIPKQSFRFHSVDWGRLRTRSSSPQLPNNSQTLVNGAEIQFNPTARGVSIVDAKTNKTIGELVEDEQTPTSFGIARNGKWLASGGDGSLVRVWNVAQRRCVRTFHAAGGVVEALWFDPKGRSIITLAKRNICQIWRVDLICNHPKKLRAPLLLCLINSSEELQERQSQIETSVNLAREAVARDDRRQLVQAFRSAKKIAGWESERDLFAKLLEQRVPRVSLTEAIQTLQLQAHDGDASALATAWNASFFVSAGKDRAVRVWVKSSQSDEVGNARRGSISRARKWSQALEFDAHADWIRSISLSPNNRFLVSGSWDRRVILWDLATGSRLFTLSEKVKNLTNVLFAPDGRTILCAGGDGTASLWDLTSNKALLRLNIGSGSTRAVAFGGTGDFFVTATEDSVVRFWNGRSGLPFKELTGFNSDVSALDLSFDNTKLVVGCKNGTIHVVDLSDKSGRTRAILSGHLGAINSLKFFPDGEWLASSAKDKTARIWNLRAGREVQKLTNLDADFCSVVLDSSGTAILCGDESGVVRGWKLQWDYDERETLSRDEIVPRLSALSARLALKRNASKPAFAPENRYQLGAEKFPKTFADYGKLEPALLGQIFAEAKYRGLCDVSYETVRGVVGEFWKGNVQLPTP
ncbi:MAG: protein kinase [Thermoguttaceae bacterium]|nr:protein kinase [Thermoguttaceae bacterium]